MQGIELQRQTLRTWCEKGHPELRLLIVEAPGGAGLSTFLGEVARAPALVIDDGQRRPAELGQALSRLAAEPDARALIGIDTDDDHRGCHAPDEAIAQHGLDARLTMLEPWDP